MNIDTIVRTLRADRRINEYKIERESKRSVEWYFVGNTLDTSRSVETEEFRLTVYADGGTENKRTRGAFTTLVNPGMDETELGKAVDKAARAAQGMSNPWYPLAEPSAEKCSLPESGFEGKPVEFAMEGLRAALFAPSGEDGTTINSLELFLSRKEIRIVNSRGVDVSFASWSGFGEFIVNANALGREEVELYGSLSFSEPDYPRLSKAVRDLETQARDRLVAVATPSCEGLPVLFRGDLAAEIYGYWHSAAQAQPAYEKTAPFALGDIVGRGYGDAINMKAVPFVAGLPGSRPYDHEGFPLAEIDCIKDSRLSALIASPKYAHYLNIPASGDLPLYELAAGAKSEAELASVPHLEAVAFSDFFVDPTTGDFGGELRLGYRVENGKRIPVSGGSVTGNMGANAGCILLSREREARGQCLSPSACLLPKASVASAN